MKVLMTTDAVGGVWTYAVDLARGLGRHDVEVALVSLGPAPTKEQRAAVEELDHVMLHVEPFDLEWMHDPWEDVARAGERLLALAHQHAPDVVHLNGYAHGALPWPAPVVVVAHSSVTTWWHAVHGEGPPPAWDTYRRVVQRGLLGADLVVAPTSAMLGDVERHHGPFEAPTAVVVNGRDPDAFAPGEKEPLVAAVGRPWDEAKNLSTLSKAAADLTWPVLVAGDTEAPDGSPAPRLPHAIHLGRIPDRELRNLLGRAGVYVHPARYEPFGLGPLEAGLAGCCLALADIPTLREVWGDAAAYAPPDDAGAWSRLLRDLIDDAPRREDLARKARARSLTLTHTAAADAYVDHYRRLTAQRRRTARRQPA